MAETTWTTQEGSLIEARPNRLKFMIGGLLMLGAVLFLVINGMRGNMQLYVTVDEFYAQQDELIGRNVRVAGWVIGDSIKYTQIDATNSRLEFSIVENINNPDKVIHIIALNEPLPDLLQHEAQAIVEGKMNPNGEFYANKGGVLLKCPTRYEELDPAGHPKGVSN